MSRKATFFRIAGIDSVAIWIFPEKSHADKSNAKWETFMRFYQVFQFFFIFITYTQRNLNIWTLPLDSTSKTTDFVLVIAQEVRFCLKLSPIFVCRVETIEWLNFEYPERAVVWDCQVDTKSKHYLFSQTLAPFRVEKLN